MKSDSELMFLPTEWLTERYIIGKLPKKSIDPNFLATFIKEEDLKEMGIPSSKTSRDVLDIIKYGLEMGEGCRVFELSDSPGKRTYHIDFPFFVTHIMGTCWDKDGKINIPCARVPLDSTNHYKAPLVPKHFARLDFYFDKDSFYLDVERPTCFSNEPQPEGLIRILKALDAKRVV